jgi:nuclear pore complex protein Nup50
MSFKRAAGTDLNHDNWNEEHESEDAGEFKKASEDILQQRTKKVARRRMVAGSDDKAPASNPFGAFGGFGSSTPAASSPFSFLSKLPAVTPQTTTNKTNGELKSSSESNKTEKLDNSAYFSKVKSLNTAFIDWIKSNIDENKGLCDLTPIFKDYEKYIKECKELKDKKAPESKNEEKEVTKSTFTFGKPASTNSSSFLSAPDSTPSIFSSIPKSNTISPAKPAVPESKPFSFGMASSNSITNNLSSAPSFSFGLQKTSTAITSTPAPIFGNLTSTPSVPFSFSNVGQNTTVASTETKTNEEETEEEPPKNEFVPVVEEDSLYSKRCKVFVKSGADYADRGIGTLFLKKVDDKVQLIVRADTNLGNILLNIIICDGLPTSRLGKNNVMIVCLPTPESKPPPIPVLVRVKTAVEADELLATLEKYKSQAS